MVRLIFVMVCTTLARAAFMTNPDAALSAAKASKRPLLISFYGIWCPPCNQLEEAVFESSAFLKASESFVLLKVDADSTSSWSIKHRFRVGGYPTIIFANHAGEEIYRVVGYRGKNEFLRTMSWVNDNRKTNLATACRGTTKEALWHCGYACAEKMDPVCARAAFKKLESKLRRGDSRIPFIKTYEVQQLPEGRRAAGYRKLMGDFPKSPFVFLWASEIMNADSEDARVASFKAAFQAALGQYGAMLRHPDLSLTGLTQTDLMQVRAAMQDKLGDREAATKAWREVASRLASMAKELPKGSRARGYTLERINCLAEAGELQSALKLADEYRQLFPNEFTFHFRSAHLMKKQGKVAEATQVARQAYAVSYGDNKIRTATLLVELLGATGNTRQARSVYEEVKLQISPDATLDVRTHRYLSKLDEAYFKQK